jgi:hypothetical protein
LLHQFFSWPSFLMSEKKCNLPFLISEIIYGTFYRSINCCLYAAIIWCYEIISSF